VLLCSFCDEIALKLAELLQAGNAVERRNRLQTAKIKRKTILHFFRWNGQRYQRNPLL